jgi:hypothetical protein
MHDPASELLGIPILRTPVNRVIRKGLGVVAPAPSEGSSASSSRYMRPYSNLTVLDCPALKSPNP